MRAAIEKNRTWFIILGVVLLVVGIVAILFPFVTTVAAKTVLGWLFLIGGVFQIFHAFSTQKWTAFFLNLVIAILYVIVGAWLAFFPLAGIITLTILLAAMFIAQGILEIGMSMRLRSQDGWVWVLVSGLIAIAVGVLIFAQLPSSAVWAIGLLVGINLISSGWAYLFLALASGKKA
jgi:uncharacterized membrane protein HdeD (DUF308 family)